MKPPSRNVPPNPERRTPETEASDTGKTGAAHDPLHECPHEPPIERALEGEAIRLCRRYIDEVVLPYDLCPWAAPALRQQRVEITVISDAVREPGQAVADAARRAAEVLERFAAEPRIELVLLVLPRFALDRSEFDALLRAVRERTSTFVMAAFHPDAPLDLASPERLVPFLRRSPDPMIQAVRRDVLDRIDPGRGTGTAFIPLADFLTGALDAAPEPSPRERVAQANRSTILRVGAEVVEQTLGAIHEDRRRTYEALGVLEARGLRERGPRGRDPRGRGA